MSDPPDHPGKAPSDSPAAESFPVIGDNPQFAGADDINLSTMHTRLDDAADPVGSENVLSGEVDTDAPTQAMGEQDACENPPKQSEEMSTLDAPAAPAAPKPKKAVSESDLLAAYIQSGLFAPAGEGHEALALLTGRYVITRLIGRGGMGVVFLAHDRQADCEVAVKTIHPRYLHDPDAKQRFIDEAQQMARIPSHASVLVVKDVSNAAQPYYTMEFMPQGSLGRLIRERGALDRASILRLARSIARAAEYVHVSAGAIHRDIKPENVLLAEDGTARLCDFGLIRRVGSGAIGLRSGTLAYMPPEVVNGGGKNVGFEWDIYSIGALMYEMLTGKPPYAESLGSSSSDGAKRIETLQEAIKDHPPRPILLLNRKADRGLVAIAQWAMARNKRERYVQVADLLADLKRVAKHQKPLGPRQKNADPARQRKIGMSVLTLLILGAAAFGIYTLVDRRSNVTDSDHTATLPIPQTGNPLLDQTNPDASFTVKLDTPSGRTHFVDNEPLQFVVGPAEEACYFTVLLFSVGSDDPPVMLYPNDYQKAQLLQPGASISVPNDQAIANRFRPIVEAPFTPVLVKVLATKQPIRLANIQSHSAQVIVDSEDVTMGASVREVLEIDQWATAELLITTGPIGSKAPEN